jgi:hypothetical protein
MLDLIDAGVLELWFDALCNVFFPYICCQSTRSSHAIDVLFEC